MSCKISIIIPCYNRAQILRKTLSAYDRQIPIEGGFEIIAIDDGSTDDTFEILDRWCPKGYNLRVLRQKNSGPGVARNRAIEIAQGEFILFTGDDIIPSKNFLFAHIEAHKKIDKPKVAVLGKIIWDEEIPISTIMSHITGLGAQQFSYYYMIPGTYVDFRHFYTSNISIRTKFLRSIDHLFDLDFREAAFEDTELGYRLEKDGMKIYYTDSALALHHHFYSVKTFCNRQYNAGLISNLLVRKHPELKKYLWSDYLTFSRLYSLLPSISKNRVYLFSKEQKLEILEEAVVRLTEQYEFCSIPYLDALYLSLFSYYFVKGQAESSLDIQKARYIWESLAIIELLPAVQNFLHAIRKNKVYKPLPEFNLLEASLGKLTPAGRFERILIYGFRKLRRFSHITNIS